MHDETATQLRLEPSGLGRHDLAAVSDVHNLLHRDRIEGEGCTHLTAIYTTLQLAEATQAANEVDAVGAAQVTDVQDVLKDEAAGDIDIEDADGVAVVVGAVLCHEREPVAVEVERKLMQASGLVDLRTLVHDGEVLAQSVQELLRGEAVEVLHNTVVVEDGELRCLEGHCHEVVVLLVATMVGILLRLLSTHESRSSGTVVAVGDVEGRHLAELLGDGGDVGSVADDPELVAETVDRGNEIVLRLQLGVLADELQQYLVVGIRKEDRLDVGVVHSHVLHSVFLLVGACQLVLLDSSTGVVATVSPDDDAILRLLLEVLRRQARRLCVDVVLFFLVLD